jgi:hypothetical protein
MYLVIHDHAVAGTIFGGFGLAGLIEAFLLGTQMSRQRKEKDDSPEEDAEQ